jgi:hypothetical protein
MTSVVAFDIMPSGLRDGEPEWWAPIEVRGSITLLVETMRALEPTAHSGAGGFPRRAEAMSANVGRQPGTLRRSLGTGVTG